MTGISDSVIHQINIKSDIDNNQDLRYNFVDYDSEKFYSSASRST